MSDSIAPKPSCYRTHSYEVDDIQAVMRFLKLRLDAGCAAVPTRPRPWIPNAMLNLAVERILAVQSPEEAATILTRLADLVANGERPSDAEAFRLSGHDA